MDKSREQFEAWHKTQVNRLAEYGEAGGAKKWNDMKWMCEAAWQASRDAVMVELPYVRSYPANEAASDVDYYIDEGRHDMRAECRKAIEAQGLKVKK